MLRSSLAKYAEQNHWANIIPWQPFWFFSQLPSISKFSFYSRGISIYFYFWFFSCRRWNRCFFSNIYDYKTFVHIGYRVQHSAGECGNIDMKWTFDFDLWFRIGKLWRFIKYLERNFCLNAQHMKLNCSAVLLALALLWERLLVVGIRLVDFVSPYIKHFKSNTIT